MDETPLFCASGHNPGGRGGVGWHGPDRCQLTRGRDDAHDRCRGNDEHRENAGDVHVSPLAPKERVTEGGLQT